MICCLDDQHLAGWHSIPLIIDIHTTIARLTWECTRKTPDLWIGLLLFLCANFLLSLFSDIPTPTHKHDRTANGCNLSHNYLLILVFSLSRSLYRFTDRVFRTTNEGAAVWHQRACQDNWNGLKLERNKNPYSFSPTKAHRRRTRQTQLSQSCVICGSPTMPSWIREKPKWFKIWSCVRNDDLNFHLARDELGPSIPFTDGGARPNPVTSTWGKMRWLSN